MKIIRNPELKGILFILLIILIISAVTAAITGNLEKWFNITWFSGQKLENKIVYIDNKSGKNEIWAMNPDGSDQKQIYMGLSTLEGLCISPFANKIMFVSMGDNQTQVFYIDPSGSRIIQMTSATGSKSFPYFSPDGKLISYISAGKVYTTEVTGGNTDYVLPTHEELQVTMYNRSESPTYVDYIWGYDNKSMLGVRRDEMQGDVLVFLGDITLGKGLVMPLSKEPNVRVIGLGASKNNLVFAASVKIGDKYRLFKLDADSEQGGIIADFGPMNIGKPAVSPDGSYAVVAIKSDDKSKSALLNIDLDSGQIMPLVKGEFEDLTYSDNGEKLLATKIDNSGKKDIYLIEISDGSIKQLTKDGTSFNGIFTPSAKKE